ncbi:MAG: hypothetical protein R3C28_06385 [Pirellulaceae bacterium]
MAKVTEDPTFHLERDPQTKELVMTGMSELHLGMIKERLARRDKLELETKEPKIPYRETIQIPADKHRHKKQSGGRGQFRGSSYSYVSLATRNRDFRILDESSLPFAERTPLRRKE